MVGYYSAAEKLYIAFRGIYQPLMNAIYPYMAKYRNISLYKKIFKSSLVLNSVSCILLFVFSKQLVTLLFGSNFQQSILVLKIFSVALFLVVPAILLGYPFLAALGFARYANGSVIAGSLFHLAALAIISQFYINPWLVAAVVVMTESIVLISRIYGVRKHNLWVQRE
jgi:PST family polysaccharide transporter